jgi:predicted permease
MRFYRLLLRLYPASFRNEYEDELAAVFAERARHLSRFRIALAGIADILPNALLAHGELLLQDLRFAFRSFRRAPGFAVTAILVAALGIGANTAAFSLADFVLVRPLPFAQPDRLLKLWESNPGGRNNASPANYHDWRTQSRSFTAMGAYTTRAANLVGMGEPRRLETVMATPEVLPLLGVQPILGRHFSAQQARAEHPAILSHALWQTQFGGRNDVIGKVVRLDGVTHTVVAVMPPTFHFPRRGIDAWTPLVFDQEDYEDRTDTYLEVVGRLRSGVSEEQARRELAVIASRLERQYPDQNEKIGVAVLQMRDEMSQNAKLLVIALCGAALCILLLSCANVASLFLARGAHRARELAVRSALGAGRERLVRQLITESFAIAVLGGIVGVSVAAVSVPLLTRLVPAALPVSATPSVDLRVLAMAALFVVITGVAFGVLPAVRAGGTSALEALRADARSGGGRTQRLRAMLVVLEIVASVVLLVSAGLLIRAVWNLQATKPGFVPDDVLTVRTALPTDKYEKIARREQFFEPVLDEVRALPGVQGAAFITGLPLETRGFVFDVSIGGVKPPVDGSHGVTLRQITPQYFATMRIPLLRGRDVADTDTQTSPYVAVVSESFVKQHWPGQDALGKQFKVAFFDRTVVGIVGDVRVRGLDRNSEPQVYLPYRQVPDGGLISYTPKSLVVRASVPLGTLVGPMRRIVQRADAEQPMSNVRTLESIVEEDTAPRVIQLRLLMALAAIALLIAGVGIHGLLTYTVSKRLPELGVRRALGAQATGIVKLVVREGVVLAAIGIAVGALLAYFAARAMGALLFGIEPADPLTFTAACALCFMTVVAGCLRPAVRAARVDPMIALRSE